MSERKDRRDETALRHYRGAAIERAIDTALKGGPKHPPAPRPQGKIALKLRTGIFGWTLRLITWATLVVFPVLLLLLLQIQFLAFHDVRITNAQRAALFLNIVLLWPLRRPILADLSVESFGLARLPPRALREFGLALTGVMSIAALWFSLS